MKPQPQNSSITVEEYLAGEQRAEVRHEYVGGTVYAMAGASNEHIAIAMNLAFALSQHLQGSPCRVQISEGKVHLKIGAEDIFYYPDVMVFCDPRDTDRYSKRYPKVLIEVLSESTEAIDRREKALNYRQLETLEEYVLVAQNKIEVTLFRRAVHWQPEILMRVEESLRLPSLAFSLPVSRLYAGVEI